MRVLLVLVMTVLGWVSSAPPQPQDTKAPSAPQPPANAPSEDLLPALYELARRKRGSLKTNLPYSHYRPAGGLHRYRYPLYRKRSSPVSYDFDDDTVLDLDLSEPSQGPRGPSLFRERQHPGGDEAGLTHALPIQGVAVPLAKKADYNLASAPYDLEAIRRMYELGKRNALDLAARKTLRPSAIQDFYSAIDADKRAPVSAVNAGAQAEMLRNYLASAASGYWGYEQPAIRRKRAATTTTTTTDASTNSTGAVQNLSATVPLRYQGHLSADRKKRAFSDYFKWEKRTAKDEVAAEEEEEEGGVEASKRAAGEELDDFLTREYFKSIARSVGQKRKRMAYAQFHADKRSGLAEILNNPSMLTYMMTKLNEAKAEVVQDAEGEPRDERVLSTAVQQLDALEKMTDALKTLMELSQVQQQQQQQGAADKRSPDMARARRGDHGFPTFPGNKREDCPILDRILMNCEGVSARVGDRDQVFLGPCVRHEICYMCGSGQGVTAHECDAVLSAALEAACFGTLECLGAAGDTFELLGDQTRYDQDGTCTHDPCVRQVLESR